MWAKLQKKLNMCTKLQFFLYLCGENLFYESTIFNIYTSGRPFYRSVRTGGMQGLLVPEGYDKVPTDFVSLLRKAVESGKQLLIVDEPSKELTMEERQVVNNLFREAQERGATVLAVNMVTAQNQVTL